MGEVYKIINESPYKIKIILPESKEIMILDVSGGGFHKNNGMHLGAHMFNDPMLTVPKAERDETVYNVKIAHDLTFVAEKEINIVEEIYGSYNFDRE